VPLPTCSITSRPSRPAASKMVGCRADLDEHLMARIAPDAQNLTRSVGRGSEPFERRTSPAYFLHPARFVALAGSRISSPAAPAHRARALRRRPCPVFACDTSTYRCWPVYQQLSCKRSPREKAPPTVRPVLTRVGHLNMSPDGRRVNKQYPGPAQMADSNSRSRGVCDVVRCYGWQGEAADFVGGVPQVGSSSGKSSYRRSRRERSERATVARSRPPR
jgi:hypothetical protein